MNFSNIQWSVTKSVNVTFLFRLEGLKLNDTDWINNLKEKRTQYGVSQNRLAVMAGVSREYVSRLESGKVALTEEIHGRSGKTESRESAGNGLGLRQNPIPHTGR